MRKVLTAFFLILILGVFLLIFKEINSFQHNDKGTILRISSFKKIITSPNEYTEIINTSNNTLSAIYFDLNKNRFLCDVYQKTPNQNFILIKKSKDLPSAKTASLFVDLKLKKNNHQTIITSINQKNKSSIQYQNNKKKILLTSQLTNFSEPSLAEDGFFYTAKTKTKSRIYFLDEKTKTSNPIKIPFKNAQYYSPYYWQKPQALFYTGILYKKQTNNQNFRYVLFLQKGADETISLSLGQTNQPFLKYFKVEGNANGETFCHQSSFISNNSLLFYHMNYYPFNPNSFAQNKMSSYAAGYALSFDKIQKIHTFKWDNKKPLRLYLIARLKNNPHYSIFQVDFSKIQIKENYKLLDFSTLFLLIIIQFIILIFFRSFWKGKNT